MWDKANEYAYDMFLCALFALFFQCLFYQFIFLFQYINLRVYQSIFVSLKQFFLKYLITAETRNGFHTVL